MADGYPSAPTPVAFSCEPPSSNPAIGSILPAAPALAVKGGSSAVTAAPGVAAQAASAGTAGLAVAELQTPFRPAVPLISCTRQMAPVPALVSTDPVGHLPEVTLLTTYT